MSARLATDLWVAAYRARLEATHIPAYVTAKGDATAGAVVVKCALLDGTARAYHRSFDADFQRVWVVLSEGAEADVDAVVARERANDPDLWVIEVESRDGRTLLDEEGLA